MKQSTTIDAGVAGLRSASTPVAAAPPDFHVSAAFRTLDVREWAAALRPFGIILSPADEQRLASGRQAGSAAVLALVEADGETPGDRAAVDAAAKELVARFAKIGVFAILVAKQWHAGLGTYLEAGASGVLLADSTPAQAAASIWSTLAQCRKLREVGTERQKLQRLLDRTAIVQRGAAFIAQTLCISQEEAVRQLRLQARNSRTPMQTIAQKIIQAQTVVGLGASVDAHADGRRS